MSDTSDKITKILSDPESIKMISEIAESFIGNANNAEASAGDYTASTKSEDEQNENNLAGGIDAITQIASNLSSIVSNNDIDNTVRLISALKPYMSTHRKQSADSVLKMLNLLRVVGGIGFSELSGLFGLSGK